MLESYKTEIVDMYKIDFAWLNSYCKTIEGDLLQFFPDSKKPFSTGYYLRFKRGSWTRTRQGTFVRAENSLFLQERKVNFYA